MSSVQTTATSLKEQQANALTLLAKGRQSAKTTAMKTQIKAIDPDTASRRDRDRLAALCRRVESFNSGELDKTFGRQEIFDRRRTAANPQNHRGTRGRRG